MCGINYIGKVIYQVSEACAIMARRKSQKIRKLVFIRVGKHSVQSSFLLYFISARKVDTSTSLAASVSRHNPARIIGLSDKFTPAT